jgi:hypothetical protein
MPTHAAVPLEPVPFSLFQGDRLHRVYMALGMSKFSRLYVLKRCLLAVLLTWVPTAALAVLGNSYGGGVSPLNFFVDFAAYAQFLIAMPLFMLADPIVDTTTRNAARQFIHSGVIRPDDLAAIYQLHARLKRVREAAWPDVICIIVGYLMALAVMAPEFGPHPLPTWHVRAYAHWRMFSPAGAWETLVALPILNYTWLRFVWKIVLWIYYLQRLSRARLDIHPTHPDQVGGLGFVSQTQAQFSIVILAYGISNVAATIGYEILILHYDWSKPPVWGPLLGFALCAPLLFTLPLLMFTRQLYRSKRRALALYRQRVSNHSRRVENRWLTEDSRPESAAEEIRELTELTTLSTMFTRIQSMRVVPFDILSFTQLLGSSMGSVAVLLPLLNIHGKAPGLLDAAGKLFGHIAGAH